MPPGLLGVLIALGLYPLVILSTLMCFIWENILGGGELPWHARKRKVKSVTDHRPE
jgi:hypothetical protein